MTDLRTGIDTYRLDKSRRQSIAISRLNSTTKAHFMDTSQQHKQSRNINSKKGSIHRINVYSKRKLSDRARIDTADQTDDDSLGDGSSSSGSRDVTVSHVTPELHRRHSTKRNSLAISGVTNRGKSYSDGKIVTQILNKDSTDSGTPTQNKRARNKLQKTIDRRKMLYKKFQMYARITVFCGREANAHILRNKSYDEISPYLNTLSFYDFAVGDTELMFDVNKFKADKQLRISEETKRVLGKPSYERTVKELRYAQIALRNIASFAEYPVRMQRKIVEVGRYEKYESKRVIVRQGHPASAFYFLLSGSVVIMVYEGDTKVSKPVAYLKKGQTFGELAIIHRTTRQSTVVAKETIEMLSIDIEDFHNIFMAGGVKNITDPDHNDFLRSLPLLRTWPIEHMLDNPDKCVFHYFKRGEVMVKDSKYSDWVFIVKSGSLQVLKKLKRVEAYGKTEDGISEYMTERKKREEKEEREKQRRYILPDINIPLSAPVEKEDLQLPTTPYKHKHIDEHINVNEGVSIMTRLQDIIGKTSSSISERGKRGKKFNNTNIILPPIKRSGTFHLSQSPHTAQITYTLGGDRTRVAENLNNKMTLSLSEINVARVNNENRMKSIHIKGKNTQNSSTPSHSTLPVITFHDDTGTLVDSSDGASVTSSLQSKKTKVTSSNQESQSLKSKQELEDEKHRQELVDQKNNIRTITHDLDSTTKHPDDITQADRDPQFVHIQTLTKGQVFGISELILGAQPSFCLVSSGAECVMLNKDFYIQHASESLVRTLRLELSPYPSDNDMQRELQATIDWEAFKNTTFKSTLKNLGISLATANT